MKIYLVSNSPGEVTTFVRPVAAALRERYPDWHLQVCLVPCPYATGAEKKVIESWSERLDVWSPWETTRAWLTAAGRGEPGAVVFLGGDPWHALLLKSRFRLPALAYFFEHTGWEESKWLGGFDRVALGYKKGLEGRQCSVNDLRVDAVRARLAEVETTEKPALALFPGSRWLHLKAVLGPFLHMLDQVKERVPELEILLAASPFITPDRLQDAASKPFELGLHKTTGDLRGDDLTTKAGTKIKVVWGDPYAVMARCQMAVSLPGTNTAELAIAGKPTVVPLTYRVPVGGGGILGILDRLPGFESLKRRLKERKKNKISMLALPNQLAGREVMPEFFIRDDLSDLTDFVVDLYQDESRRREIGLDAQDVMGPPGGANQVVDLIEELTRRVS